VSASWWMWAIRPSADVVDEVPQSDAIGPGGQLRDVFTHRAVQVEDTVHHEHAHVRCDHLLARRRDADHVLHLQRIGAIAGVGREGGLFSPAVTPHGQGPRYARGTRSISQLCHPATVTIDIRSNPSLESRGRPMSVRHMGRCCVAYVHLLTDSRARCGQRKTWIMCSIIA
jgi:hypothetical protein